jgi:hypothetical protein
MMNKTQIRGWLVRARHDCYFLHGEIAYSHVFLFRYIVLYFKKIEVEEIR